MDAKELEHQIILFRKVAAARDKFLNVQLQTQIGPVGHAARAHARVAASVARPASASLAARSDRQYPIACPFARICPGLACLSPQRMVHLYACAGRGVSRDRALEIAWQVLAMNPMLIDWYDPAKEGIALYKTLLLDPADRQQVAAIIESKSPPVVPLSALHIRHTRR
jgi:hypothetical protein